MLISRLYTLIIYKNARCEENTIVWTLNQLGVLQTEIKEMNNKIINIIETMTFLERRISAIEGYIFKENEDFNKDSLENEKLSLI